jgi:hypothetical protein
MNSQINTMLEGIRSALAEKNVEIPVMNTNPKKEGFVPKRPCPPGQKRVFGICKKPGAPGKTIGLVKGDMRAGSQQR